MYYIYYIVCVSFRQDAPRMVEGGSDFMGPSPKQYMKAPPSSYGICGQMKTDPPPSHTGSFPPDPITSIQPMILMPMIRTPTP